MPESRGGSRSSPQWTSPRAPDLHLVGFTNPPTGNLRELARDARRVARALRASIAARTREGALPSHFAPSARGAGSLP